MPRTPLFYYNIVCSMNKNENILKKRIQNALGQTVFSGFTKILGTTGKKGSIMNLLKFLRQSGEERTERVLTGKIYSTMLFLAVPSFLMLISQALATTFDNWFIYNFSTLTSGGVISYSVQAFNVIYNAGIGLSVAGTAILSRFNGQGDWRGSRHYTEQFLALMMLLSGALAVLTAVLAGFYASLALPELQSGIRLAMRLYAVSIPFAYFNNAYYAMKNAMGKSEIPFVFTFLMVGTKVLCNAIFVAVLDLGVLGIGLATICSHVVVSLFLVVDVFFRKKGMRLHFKGFRFDPSAIRTLLVVGIPSVINNMAMSVGFWLINLESMKFGNEILNSINIGNNISSLMYKFKQLLRHLRHNGGQPESGRQTEQTGQSFGKIGHCDVYYWRNAGNCDNLFIRRADHEALHHRSRHSGARAHFPAHFHFGRAVLWHLQRDVRCVHRLCPHETAHFDQCGQSVAAAVYFYSDRRSFVYSEFYGDPLGDRFQQHAYRAVWLVCLPHAEMGR